MRNTLSTSASGSWIHRLVLLVGLSLATTSQANPGEAIYKDKCGGCHGANGEGTVGPNLTDDCHLVGNDPAAIRKVIADGSPNNPTMFAFAEQLDEAALDAVTAYVVSLGGTPVDGGKACEGERSGGGAATGSDASVGDAPDHGAPVPDPASVQLGRELFEGTTRFSGGGVACLACHRVDGLGGLGGGTFSKNLTDAGDRLGPSGVRSIALSAPFPAMRQAYGTRPITQEEADALAAFLGQPGGTGAVAAEARHLNLLLVGLGGCFLLLGAFWSLWPRRRRRGVYHDLYERQQGAAN